MILYHYTAPQHLAGIAKHGLTVGDVPTDLRRYKGRVGVWLTTSPEATGHGLAGSSISKRRYRLTVDVPPSAVVKWAEWAPGNVTPETFENLKRCAGSDGPSQWETWFVCFGVVRPAAIVACRDMLTGLDVEDWATTGPAVMAVPAWRREAWHRGLSKHHARSMRMLKARGVEMLI
ncbi:hypothetical protein [Methylobacterium isbiliense]|uniref:Uncharacterized protein n=1 Tax=Methylobacterium isbiliense TaxID=315478 RepID=A0ABQ4SCX5_9HYPH|nr:hypothetical protein [Methylobacterium isbiliense]MDN3621450.1 hypothetical protein [Methylobacterium isbiliense]GJE00914.1 hypothetical protein GMJLKIPL_2841 [Methylobacterium isbiliense]